MEFVLTVLVIFVVFGWILKKLFPMLLAWYIKRKMKNGGGSFGSFGPFGGFTGGVYGEQGGTFSGEDEVRRSKAEEGKVTVTTVEEKEKVIEDDMGEYVDFEEEKQ